MIASRPLPLRGEFSFFPGSVTTANFESLLRVSSLMSTHHTHAFLLFYPMIIQTHTLSLCVQETLGPLVRCGQATREAHGGRHAGRAGDRQGRRRGVVAIGGLVGIACEADS